MKTALCLAVCSSLLFLTGCETRSISDSGYHSGWGRVNSMYNGELTEFDILGTAAAQDATEANIAKALQNSGMPSLKRGDKILLIQSGALVPDNEMMDEITPYFSVAPFSGVPPSDKTGLANSLRLRAAQGGYRDILCYWGVLESAQVEREGKTVSWVPVVGAFVPDQQQQMRIRLKGLLVDVSTGSWKMLLPEVHSDASLNSTFSRERSDQKLVVALKERGYKSLVTDLLKE